MAQLTAAEAVGHVDSLQPQFSLIHRDAAAELIPWCAAHRTGVIGYSPMEVAGLLTGAFTPERAANLDQGDWRSRSATSPATAWPGTWRWSMAPARPAGSLTLAAVTVAWTLAFP